MKKYLIIIMAIVFTSCNFNHSVTGKYKAVNESAIIKAITFDENVATFHGSVFSLMPSMKYSVKDNKIYVDTEQGIWVFDIIDATTIECKTSIFKGERFRK